MFALTEPAQEKKQGAAIGAKPLANAGSTGNKFDSEMMKLTHSLTKRFMSKVEIKGTQKSGQIQIHYSSKEELSRLFASLMGE